MPCSSVFSESPAITLQNLSVLIWEMGLVKGDATDTGANRSRGCSCARCGPRDPAAPALRGRRPKGRAGGGRGRGRRAGWRRPGQAAALSRVTAPGGGGEMRLLALAAAALLARAPAPGKRSGARRARGGWGPGGRAGEAGAPGLVGRPLRARARGCAVTVAGALRWARRGLAGAAAPPQGSEDASRERGPRPDLAWGWALSQQPRSSQRQAPRGDAAGVQPKLVVRFPFFHSSQDTQLLAGSSEQQLPFHSLWRVTPKTSQERLDLPWPGGGERGLAHGPFEVTRPDERGIHGWMQRRLSHQHLSLRTTSWSTLVAFFRVLLLPLVSGLRIFPLFSPEPCPAASGQ